jgi:hypothetical protein
MPPERRINLDLPGRGVAAPGANRQRLVLTRKPSGELQTASFCPPPYKGEPKSGLFSTFFCSGAQKISQSPPEWEFPGKHFVTCA